MGVVVATVNLSGELRAGPLATRLSRELADRPAWAGRLYAGCCLGRHVIVQRHEQGHWRVHKQCKIRTGSVVERRRGKCKAVQRCSAWARGVLARRTKRSARERGLSRSLRVASRRGLGLTELLDTGVADGVSGSSKGRLVVWRRRRQRHRVK